MASASVRITRFDTEAERDAIENWEEGDMAYVVADHALFWLDDNDTWQQVANNADIPAP